MTSLNFANISARNSFREEVIAKITLQEPPVAGCVEVGYHMFGRKMEARRAPIVNKWELYIEGDFFTDFLWE